jgi:hypothetical protein
MGLSLMNMLGLSSVHFAHIACYWKFFLLHYTQVLCQYRLCKACNAYLTYLMLQRQPSHLNGRKLDHRLTLSYTANMFILMILYDFCLLPTQFCYIIIIHTEGWNSLQQLTGPAIISMHGPHRKHRLHYCCIVLLPWKHAFSEPYLAAALV